MEDMLKNVSENYAKNIEELREGLPEEGILVIWRSKLNC